VARFWARIFEKKNKISYSGKVVQMYDLDLQICSIGKTKKIL
jgi:hypothetical protein